MINQAMILAAGKGTRLRPLTFSIPKPLVAVGGKPLIVWHILALKQAGIQKIVINVSWLADKLINALGDGSQFGVHLKFSREDAKALETAGGIKKALADGLLSDDPFILVNGDVWTPFDFTQLTNYRFSDNQLAHLLLTDKATHNPNGDFSLTNNLVTLTDLPKYTFAGISVIAPKLLQNVTLGEIQPLAPILKQAIARQQVTGALLNDNWVDVGELKRLESLNQYLAQQNLAQQR
ncbi:nucleotidyl transferase [Moraxella macacae 0408225]|uniref:Nucleotidyl transferase n=1 Tax=Moraxella macacae 0408225 TaxID=1230338 RepID=L2F6E8_9GAMM|nr:nucleotidyltransferase family protein [Moraxella macacae]ELA08490.1 nucleotidyl transferase [Moraxella macacae 0408225]